MTPQQEAASGLSRDAVIQAALDLLDTAGVEGLSMRAVAERLGVKAASLYWHLRDKDQLLESLTESVLDRVDVPVAPPGWRAQVTAACEDLARVLREHHTAAPVVLGCLPTVRRSRLTRDLARTLAVVGLDQAESAAFALVVAVVTAASVTTGSPPSDTASGMTLAIDSGSWRVQVRAAAPGTREPATSIGGGGAASVDVRPGGREVVVRNRRGGNGGGVELSPEYTWKIKVHGGTWNTSLDLSALRIGGIELDSGAGNVSCVLPAPIGVVPIRVNSGIVGVTMSRPPGTAVQATVSSGSVKVRFDDQAIRSVTSDVHWNTPGALLNEDRYDLAVYSGCVRVTLDAAAKLARRSPHGATSDASRPEASPDQGVGLILDGIEKRLADRSAGPARPDPSPVT